MVVGYFCGLDSYRTPRLCFSSRDHHSAAPPPAQHFSALAAVGRAEHDGWWHMYRYEPHGRAPKLTAIKKLRTETPVICTGSSHHLRCYLDLSAFRSGPVRVVIIPKCYGSTASGLFGVIWRPMARVHSVLLYPLPTYTVCHTCLPPMSLMTFS